ncbi:hypothetical protein ARMGADRAFT_1022647 [Armillaria gallica]|uniref:Uncharacterized protein n=1 Tax=Armillaria gallica TaxID=47427 RepID=A0A2H3EUZ4_ARMGA|nr:hypothetical protein ARMGADRAFT_1022647 [Armillaria gallica]
MIKKSGPWVSETAGLKWSEEERDAHFSFGETPTYPSRDYDSHFLMHVVNHLTARECSAPLEALERQKTWASSGNKTALRTLPSQHKIDKDITYYLPLFQHCFGLHFQQLLNSMPRRCLVEVPERPESDGPEDVSGGLLVLSSVSDVCHMLLKSQERGSYFAC